MTIIVRSSGSDLQNPARKMLFTTIPIWTLIVSATLFYSGIAAFSRTPRDEIIPDSSTLINVSTFPECGKADCVASQAFSASRLGCKSSTITVGCFCEDSLTPLNCLPAGPSDEDNCWSESEDWMLGTCGKAILVDKDSLPECIVGCVSTHLVNLGCGPTNGTVSRNCFCKLAQLDAKLEKPELWKKIEECKKNGCWQHMSPDFSYEEWKDSVCIHGIVEKYNQKAYNSYVKKIKQTRIAMAVVIPFIALFFAVIARYLVDSREIGVLFFFIFTAVLYIAILVPLYVAL